MNIELSEEQSARIIQALIDRFLAPGSGSPTAPNTGTVFLSGELRDTLSELLSRQSGIFAALVETQRAMSFLSDRQVETAGQLTFLQNQLSSFRGEIMSEFSTLLSGIQTNSSLIAQAGTAILEVSGRVNQILAGSPSPEQIAEAQTLVAQQQEGLVKLIDTAKQTAPMTPSPVEPTPIPEPSPEPPAGEVPAPPVDEAPAPTPEPLPEIPATPDPIVVEPSPVDVGLDGAVTIDAPVTTLPVEEAPAAPAPLF